MHEWVQELRELAWSLTWVEVVWSRQVSNVGSPATVLNTRASASVSTLGPTVAGILP